MFTRFLSKGEPLVTDAALRLEEYTEVFRRGDMTLEEYDELCEDILDEEHILEFVEDVDTQIKVKKLFETLKSIVKGIRAAV